MNNMRRIDDPFSPTEGFWTISAFLLVCALAILNLVMGAGEVTGFFALVCIAAFVVALFTPRDIAVGTARAVAFFTGIGVTVIALITGMPRVIVTALDPAVQAIRFGGNVDIAVTLAWAMIFGASAVLIIMAVVFWLWGSVTEILLSGFIIAMAVLPFIGTPT